MRRYIMSRTKRLLDLLLILNNRRYSVSGYALAQELGISIRTLYRDIAILRSQGAQIEGEVGIGYVLKPSFFIPPMMFTESEVYALILGSKWVSQYGDIGLSKSANTALDKIFTVLPQKIKNITDTISLRVGPSAPESFTQEDLSALREAILNKNKIELIYYSENGNQSQRILWPFAIGYFADKRILVGWCEKQNDYRHFRTDRIISTNILQEQYDVPREKLLMEWQRRQLLNCVK
jgi:predicted DNA-binding transcriptional regulator YafY